MQSNCALLISNLVMDTVIAICSSLLVSFCYAFSNVRSFLFQTALTLTWEFDHIVLFLILYCESLTLLMSHSLCIQLFDDLMTVLVI